MTDAIRERPVIASFEALRAHLREDYAANRGAHDVWTFWTPGFQAVAVYRLGVWAGGVRPRLLRAPLRWIIAFCAFFIRNFYGVELSPKTRIGRRFAIVHQHGIVIHPKAVIGDDCMVRQGVTIGAAGGASTARRPPRLGDRVKIGAGAVLAGPIAIGDDVTIGPNAVVMQNVPAGSIVSAPQSRIMSLPPRRPEPRPEAPGATKAPETKPETAPETAP